MAEITTTEGVISVRRRSSAGEFVRRLVTEKPMGLVGAIITLALLFTGIFANVLAPYGMNEVFVGPRLAAPSAQFPFGTDNLGRDILSRVIYGARVSVVVGLSGAVVSITISLLIGVISGYLGGRFDLVVQRGVDIWMSLPSLVILMVLVSIVGRGMVSMIVLLGFIYGVPGSRIIRGAVIGVKENAYVTAARVIGCKTRRILYRHVLRNVMATAIVLFTIRVPAVVLTEAGLSFLGFGLPPPTPSWGSMISGSGRQYMFEAPWMVLWAGLALAVTVYGINMFGDALRDLVDPRMRGGSGRYGATTKKRRREAKADGTAPESSNSDVEPGSGPHGSS